MSNKVYFLGAGPGDPDLLTRRAAKLLDECSVVFVPPMYDQTFGELLEGKTSYVPFNYYFDDLISMISF